MTTLRQAAQQTLGALEGELPGWLTPAQARAIIALRAALAQQDEPVEPVAWQWLDTAHYRKKIPADATPSHWRPLYTVPPQRKPLTEEEINALELPPSGTATVRDLVRLIERAHGIGETK